MNKPRRRPTESHPLELLRVMGELGISQAEVGRCLGLHKSTMTKHFAALREGRKSTLSLDQAERVRDHINKIDVRTLVDWTVDDLFAEI